MLVLTRKPNQQLHIGNDIVITVVKVRGNTIRLGIEAPRDVRILRSELDAKPADGSDQSDLIVAEIALASQCDAAAPDDQDDSSAPCSVAEASPVAADASSGAGSIGQAAPSNSPGAVKRAPLKPFTKGKQSPAPQATRNLEDSPLCHCPPQGKRAAVARDKFGRGPLSQGDSLRERAPLGKGRANSFSVVSRP
jgi:carbon storage regulator CsrA